MIESSFWSLDPHGFHRIAYTEWGAASNAHVALCVHGLTRNARDFDDLARGLQRHLRVVCMDVAGRGRSEWLEHKDDFGGKTPPTRSVSVFGNSAKSNQLQNQPTKNITSEAMNRIMP